MADSPQNAPTPPEKNAGFLGGGPRFNSVGASYGTPGQENAPLPPAKRSGAGRTAVVVIVLVLLAGALYFLSDPTLGGLVHNTGRGGQTAPQEKPAPDKNF